MVHYNNITVICNTGRPDLERFRGEGRLHAASGTIGIGRAEGGAKLCLENVNIICIWNTRAARGARVDRARESKALSLSSACGRAGRR